MEDQRLALLPLIERRMYNHASWFQAFYENEMEPNQPIADTTGLIEHFPWRFKKKGSSPKLGVEDFFPRKPGQSMPVPLKQETRPVYLINIPSIPPKGPQDEGYKRLINLIRREAFGNGLLASIIEVKQRIAVVIGFNRPRSLESQRNVDFINFVEDLTKQSLTGGEEIAVQPFGFFWIPVWTPRECAKEEKATLEGLGFSLKQKKPSKKKTAKPAKAPKYFFETQDLLNGIQAYLLLKSRCPDSGRAVINAIEEGQQPFDNLRSQIPYQRIRQRINDSVLNTACIARFRSRAPSAPTYIALLDSDSLAMRTHELGLFSRYDQLINTFQESNRCLPHMLSTGYQLAPSERCGVLRFGIPMDMKIRCAVAKVFPNGIYLPEPNLIFLLRSNQNIGQFSFLGEGTDAEGRWFKRNAVRMKLIDPKLIVFSPEGGLITATPGRMRDKLRNPDVAQINADSISNPSILQDLAGISQSHANHMIWATNIRVGLEIKGNVGKANKPLIALFNAFSPLRFLIDYDRGNLHTTVLLDFYSFFSEHLQRSAKGEAVLPHQQAGDHIRVIKLPTTRDESSILGDYLFKKMGKVSNAQLALQTLKVDNATVKLVIEAAVASGNVMMQELNSVFP